MTEATKEQMGGDEKEFKRKITKIVMKQFFTNKQRIKDNSEKC